MNLEELLGYVLDTLYAGLTGGSAELPLPRRAAYADGRYIPRRRALARW
jgi:hypothetical protein